jgi:hypothetical protein
MRKNWSNKLLVRDEEEKGGRQEKMSQGRSGMTDV